MEIGSISSSFFRQSIIENEANAFWNDIKSNKYSLQSAENVFDGNQGRNKKISAFTLHKRELFAFSGSKDGCIAISNFSQIPHQSIPVKRHSSRISDICTSSKRPLHLFCASFDGNVKILDLSRIPSFQFAQSENGNNALFGDAIINNDSVKLHSLDLKVSFYFHLLQNLFTFF